MFSRTFRITCMSLCLRSTIHALVHDAGKMMYLAVPGYLSSMLVHCADQCAHPIDALLLYLDFLTRTKNNVNFQYASHSILLW